MEVKIADTSYVGLHLFCRISRHILPSAYTATFANKTIYNKWSACRL